MLNRRHLRIKALQSLYAWYQHEEGNLALAEKELTKNIDRIYDLYLYYMLIFGELQLRAENRIEESRNKKLPTHEDLNPNSKFVDNKIFYALANCERLKTLAKNRKIKWDNDQELIRKVFQEIQASELFRKYMSDPGRMFDQDKEFAIAMFKEFVANSEHIKNYFEEISFGWLDDMDLVCSSVIKTIKSIKENDETVRLQPLYKDEEEDAHFVKLLFRSTILNEQSTLEMINSKTENWEMERIAAMDMILMKMAVNEALTFDTIPIKVTLNEYIEISKFYSTPKSNSFINGILDKIFIELKANGKLKKVGRGLIED